MASSPNPRDPRPSSVPCRDRWAAATRRTRPFRAGRAHPCPRRGPARGVPSLAGLGHGPRRPDRSARVAGTSSKGVPPTPGSALRTDPAWPPRLRRRARRAPANQRWPVAGRPGEPQTRRFARPIWVDHRKGWPQAVPDRAFGSPVHIRPTSFTYALSLWSSLCPSPWLGQEAPAFTPGRKGFTQRASQSPSPTQCRDRPQRRGGSGVEGLPGRLPWGTYPPPEAYGSA